MLVTREAYLTPSQVVVCEGPRPEAGESVSPRAMAVQRSPPGTRPVAFEVVDGELYVDASFQPRFWFCLSRGRVTGSAGGTGQLCRGRLAFTSQCVYAIVSEEREREEMIEQTLA